MTQIDRLIQTAVGELGYTEISTSTGQWTKYANDFDNKPGWTEWFNTKKNGADWCTIFHDWCYVKTFGFNKAVQMLFNQDPYSSLRAGCAYLAVSYTHLDEAYQTEYILSTPGDDQWIHTWVRMLLNGSESEITT